MEHTFYRGKLKHNTYHQQYCTEICITDNTSEGLKSTIHNTTITNHNYFEVQSFLRGGKLTQAMPNDQLQQKY